MAYFNNPEVESIRVQKLNTLEGRVTDIETSTAVVDLVGGDASTVYSAAMLDLVGGGA